MSTKDETKHLWINNHPDPKTIYFYEDLEGNIISGHIVTNSSTELPYSKSSIYREHAEYIGVAHKFIKSENVDCSLKKI